MTDTRSVGNVDGEAGPTALLPADKNTDARFMDFFRVWGRTHPEAQPGQSIKWGHYVPSVHRQFIRIRARDGAGQKAELKSSQVWPGPRVVCTVARIINRELECPSGQSQRAEQI